MQRIRVMVWLAFVVVARRVVAADANGEVLPGDSARRGASSG